MKTYVFFSGSNSWLSKTIQWFRKSVFSHVFFVTVETIDNVKKITCVSADPKGINNKSDFFKEYANNPKCRLEGFQVYNMDAARTKKEIKKQINHGYGYLALLGFARLSLLDLFGINATNIWKWGMVCSESTRRILDAGLGKETDISKDNAYYEANSQAPDELYKVLLGCCLKPSHECSFVAKKQIGDIELGLINISEL